MHRPLATRAVTTEAGLSCSESRESLIRHRKPPAAQIDDDARFLADCALDRVWDRAHRRPGFPKPTSARGCSKRSGASALIASLAFGLGFWVAFRASHVAVVDLAAAATCTCWAFG